MKAGAGRRPASAWYGGLLALWGVVVTLGVAGCNGGAPPAATAPCPACECSCPPAVPSAPVPTAALAAPTGVSALVASANRKMLHDDGAGCLADLDAVAGLDAALSAQLVVVRGQCEMLVGRCQQGKQRLSTWYRDETNLTQERADLIAEQMGSMRCRGGDSTARDQLLRAFFELTDGAYVNRRDAAFCAERVAIVRRIGPDVTPRGPDDTQIDGGKKALFQTAASCFARAGDCTGAFEVYRDNYPGEALAALPLAQRTTIIADSFRSSVPLCAGKP